jgi:hypothetical protein
MNISKNLVRRAAFGLLSILLFTGCAPRVKTKMVATKPALSEFATVACIYPEQLPPADAELLGSLKIGDNGMSSNCGFDEVAELATRQARLSGSNLIHITEIKYPDGFSTCHRMKASLYAVPDVYTYMDQIKAKEDSITRAKMGDDQSYALIHFYRPRFDFGYAISYKMHLNDSAVCKVKHGCAQTIRIDHPECYNLNAKTESGFDLNLCVEAGEEYYIRCGVSMGAFIGRPYFSLVDKNRGRSEMRPLLVE